MRAGSTSIRCASTNRSAARTAAGYRIYDERTLDRRAFIARAKQLGCSLEEITGLTTAARAVRSRTSPGRGPIFRTFADFGECPERDWWSSRESGRRDHDFT